MSKVKTILISQIPLPFDKIGSWSTMYQYLLDSTEFNFDYIICPKPHNKFKNTNYSFLREITILDKIQSKISSKNKLYNNYIEALGNILEKDSRYVIQIVDNSGIVEPIQEFLTQKYNRSNFFIQYCYHGFGPVVDEKKGKTFLSAIDEIIFLTELSYKSFLSYYSDCTFRARVLHNGIDVSKFNRINEDEKLNLRSKLGFNQDDFIFMWCSQDRPKKGLHIVLEAFKDVYKTTKGNAKLMVVGVDKHIHQEGVIVIGRVPNIELPQYYQISDIYLFPSLWKEGFGIVLAEALNCGCYVIASAQGGIPEVLEYGKYGKLIENPNMVENWVTEMKYSMDEIQTEKRNPFLINIPKNLYSIKDWANNLSQSINEAKNRLN